MSTEAKIIEEAKTSEKNGFFSVSEEMQDQISEDVKGGQETQTIVFQDAVSESAKILVPQMGTDQNELAEGKYDTRRFTNISLVDVIWLSWFDTLPDKYGGEWSRKWADSYRNHAYSVDGENKKLVVAMQQAVSGGKDKSIKKKDERTFIQKHLTQRNKEPEELYDIE